MPDILANGDYGKDDGIICHKCGGKTYLVDDQGYGYCAYTCEDCEETFGVQFESSAEHEADEERMYAEEEGWWEDPYGDIDMPASSLPGGPEKRS